MKRSGNIYDKELTYKNLYHIYKIISANVGNKKELFRFEQGKNHNLLEIYKKLKNQNYMFSNYKIFLITDSKYRIIICENISDKIVNHFVAKFYLLKYLESSLIYENVATRKGKGSRLAFELFEKYINKDSYILKIDISKYFYNINHNIIFKLLSKKIKDKDVISLVKNIIDGTNIDYVNKDIYNIKANEIKRIENLNINNKITKKKISEINNIPFYEEGLGISIGNMTSQIIGVFYLNEVDHYIKEVLKIKKYVRYMDDLIIVDDDPKLLIKYKVLIEKKINEYKLNINNKTKIYDIKKGVEILGYKYKYNNNHLVIKYNKQTLTRINKRLKYLKKHNFNKYINSLNSYQGFFKRSNTKLKEKYRVSVFSDKTNFYKREYPEHIVIIKQGKFYKSRDFEILWYMFGYKIIDNTVGFPNIDKVIELLNYEKISYVIDYNNEELDVMAYDNNSFFKYLKLSTEKLDLENKLLYLNTKLRAILIKDISLYYKLAQSIDSL